MPRHFGILVPCTNTTCEIELCRLPGELQAHTARLGKQDSSPFSPGLDADVAYQSKMLGEAKVEVIAMAQTSASLFSDDYDEVTVKRMTRGVRRRTVADLGPGHRPGAARARDPADRVRDALFRGRHRAGAALLRDEIRHHRRRLGKPRRHRQLRHRQDGCRHG